MPIKVEFVGFDKAALRVALLDPQIKTKVQDAIQETTEEALGVALSLVPRKTGELASTLRERFSSNGMTGWVEAGYGFVGKAMKGESARVRKLKGFKSGLKMPGSYAALVEFGTQRNRPHPYLVPAVESVRPSHQARVEAAMGEAVEAAARGLTSDSAALHSAIASNYGSDA